MTDAIEMSMSAVKEAGLQFSESVPGERCAHFINEWRVAFSEERANMDYADRRDDLSAGY
jgi:hypothetical protein